MNVKKILLFEVRGKKQNRRTHLDFAQVLEFLENRTNF